MLLQPEVKTLTPAEYLNQYAANNPGKEKPTQLLVLVPIAETDTYALHLVSPRSRQLERATAFLPYSPSIESDRDKYFALLKKHGKTNADIAPIFGYADINYMQTSRQYVSGQVFQTVLAIHQLFN